jgi:DNA-directed RNA polymerase subunit K/omega
MLVHMKLAEALALRADAARRAEQLSTGAEQLTFSPP